MAGKIPQKFIEDLLLRIDIVDLINSHIPLKKTGSNFSARCPFHEEKTPSFSVSPKKQYFHCFGCGASGDAISFLERYNHLNFVEAVEDLAQFAGVEVPRENSFVAQDSQTSRTDLVGLTELMEKVAKSYASQLRTNDGDKAITYLKGRGIDGVIAKEYQLGYAPGQWQFLVNQYDSNDLMTAGMIISKEGGGYYDRFRDRIMFPIRDRRAQIIGFGGRVLDDSLPKYLNSPETPLFSKGKEVYGLYELLVRNAKPQQILVVEGYMDVIALAQNGIKYAVATLGTATTRAHLELLFRFTSELVFCFDGDKAGQRAAWRAMEPVFPCLKDRRRVKVMLLPSGHDPDSLIRSEGVENFEKRIETATMLSDYFFESLRKELAINLDSKETRSLIIEESKKYIDQLPREGGSDYRALMHEELRRITGLYIEDSSEPVRSKPIKEGAGKFKPLGLAQKIIALLIQNPDLIGIVEGKKIDWNVIVYSKSEYRVFVDFIQFVIKNRPKSFAILMKTCEGRNEFSWIKKLGVCDLEILSEDVPKVLSDALERLAMEAWKESLWKLRIKKGEGVLNAGEQSMLNNLEAQNKINTGH